MDDKAERGGWSLVTGAGFLGSGVHLVRHAERSERRVVADVWVTLLFVPVLPLGTWTLVSDGSGAPWRLAARTAPNPLRAMATVALFALVLITVLVPAALALTVLMGNTLLELAGALGSVALIVALAAWLDETRQRLPVRAVRAMLTARSRLS